MFTCTNVKSWIRDVNTVNYIHMIVFRISGPMVYRLDVGSDGTDRECGVRSKEKTVGVVYSDPEFIKYNCIIEVLRRSLELKMLLRFENAIVIEIFFKYDLSLK